MGNFKTRRQNKRNGFAHARRAQVARILPSEKLCFPPLGLVALIDEAMQWSPIDFCGRTVPGWLLPVLSRLLRPAISGRAVGLQTLLCVGWLLLSMMCCQLNCLAQGATGVWPADIPEISGLSNAVALAAGYYHILALKDDGTVAVWGDNSSGQTVVLAGVSNAIAVTGGGYQSLALTNDGRPVITVGPFARKVYSGTPVRLNVMVASGGAQVSYEWRRDGVQVAGATNPVVKWSAAATEISGDYSVVATSRLGSVTSAVARLDVLDSAPVIALQPTYLASPGGRVVMQARVEGSQPIALQWQFSGTDLPGAADVDLVVSNVQFAVGGIYSIVASNAYGSRSSDAMLWVLPVWEWGDDSQGQTTLLLDLTNCVGLAAGLDHSLALKRDGTVIAWGSNDSGQTDVPSNLSNVVAVAAGGYHSLALKADGAVAAWGFNDYHQTDVPTGLSNVTAVAAGRCHSLALLAPDQTVVGWGNSDYGQADVPSGLSNVVAIAAGYDHSVALKADGTVVVWGDPWSGQTALPNDLTNVVAVAAGGGHCLALRSDGRVIG